MKKTLLSLMLVFSFVFFSEACTGIFSSKNGIALVGTNEDSSDPINRICFVKPQPGKYGRVYLGFTNFYDACLNDQGLFYDGFTTPKLQIKNSLTKKRIKEYDLCDKVMSECATVAEVIKLFSKYNLAFLEEGQLFFADKEGNSIIIEGDDIVYKKGDFQVVTNFYQSKTKQEEIQCLRYKIAYSIMDTSKNINTELYKKILMAVHTENPNPTLYTNISDLKNGIMYLYHFHNFENVKVFKLKEEFEKMENQKEKVYDISSFFPKTYVAERFLEQYNIVKKRDSSIKLNIKKLSSYVGVFKLKDHNFTFSIIQQDAKLYGYAGPSEGSAELIPESQTVFKWPLRNGSMKLHFDKIKSGKITTEEQGRKFIAKRVK